MIAINALPQVRGTIREMEMSKLTWFRVGGKAIVFSPKDIDDLSSFLKNIPKDTDVLPIGLGSNLLIRDNGFTGIIIRMNAFSDVTVEQDTITCGTGVMDSKIAKIAQQNSITGFEFLSGIPGAIGGAIAMNAGAYNQEIKDIFISATAVKRNGDIVTFNSAGMQYAYRKCGISDCIFTSVTLQGQQGNPLEITKKMDFIKQSRESSQPIKERTGGSTFKNPAGKKAWELIDSVGLRGKKIGGAMFSTQHCNFLINTGAATAHDLETLGELARSEVQKKHNIILEWEIKRIGNMENNITSNILENTAEVQNSMNGAKENND